MEFLANISRQNLRSLFLNSINIDTERYFEKKNKQIYKKN